MSIVKDVKQIDEEQLAQDIAFIECYTTRGFFSVK